MGQNPNNLKKPGLVRREKELAEAVAKSGTGPDVDRSIAALKRQQDVSGPVCGLFGSKCERKRN